MAQKFDDVRDKMSFPEAERDILKFWEEIDAFKQSLKQSEEEGREEYTFLDGPPFATGLPHYGHILAGTIKDVICRFYHQKGRHVRRQWGWDCHGLPIEHEIDKKHQMSSRDYVAEHGLKAYNDECRSIVMTYAEEWERIVGRTGRWIDFEHDYKTMYPWFMESIWWMFGQLFKKGLVYRGVKVMPLSTALSTALSNFEANQAYTDVIDPSIIVTFPVINSNFDDDRKLVAWTTTPWTLPSNLALCVNKDMDYVLVEDSANGNRLYVMEARLPQLYPEKKKGKKGKGKGNEEEKEKEKAPYTILEKVKGQDLVGLEYKPLFTYFEDYRKRGAFKVVCDPYVSDDSGTGIVHCAPGFGEDDFRVCLANGIIGKKITEIPVPVGPDGKFTSDVVDWAGRYIKDADKEIMKKLKSDGRLISQSTIEHSYPMCWRSNTPLIYMALPAWFINVESIRDSLVQANVDTYWVPEFVKEKRFHNWLVNARDWCVSRSRYWGTPLPIWVSEDYEEVVCISSIEELRELTNGKFTGEDLHRDAIDDLVIESKQGKGQLKRVDEVFDCWFESGSMPFASRHYPFENKEEVDTHYPADFIAEGLDQTRGWFYTLLVLGVAIKGAAPFKNLIVNGLVLAADGKKMSKSLRNFPDPTKILEEIGADALRLYLVDSPVVRAEPLKFQYDGVVRVVKEVFLPWFNAYRFFVQNANIYAGETGSLFTDTESQEGGEGGGGGEEESIMDRWILALLQSLITYVHQEIEGYRLYTVVPRLVEFMDQLTNWYVRFNRRRLKGAYGRVGWRKSLSTLYEVLTSMTTIMAPLTPFLCEYMYQNLRKADPTLCSEQSVHFRMLPVAREDAMDEDVQRGMRRLEAVVGVVRLIRDQQAVPVKIPIKQITVVHRNEQYHDDLKSLEAYLKEELNVKDVKYSVEEGQYVVLQAVTCDKVLGKRYGRMLRDIKTALSKCTDEDLIAFETQNQLELEVGKDKEKIVLSEGDMEVVREANPTGPGNGEGLVTSSGVEGVVVVVNLVKDESIIFEGAAREVVSRIQRMRKASKLVPTDPVDVFYEPTNDSDSDAICKAIESCSEFIQRGTNSPILPISVMPSVRSIVLLDNVYSFSLGGLRLVMMRRSVAFDWEKLNMHCGDSKTADGVALAISAQDYSDFVKGMKENGKYSVVVDGKKVEIEFGAKCGVFESVREL